MSPTYAVSPFEPNTPRAANGSVPSASGVVSMGSSPTTAYSCQPVSVATSAPSATLSLREAITRPMPLLRTTSPISTGGM